MTRTLGGAWEVLDDVVGRGATSEVRLGRRLDDGSTVAVKLLHRDRADDPAVLQRFAREFAVLRSRPHPNVVSVLDLVTDADNQAIVMEHVEGGDLRRRLDEAPGRRVPALDAFTLVAQVADGLAHIHRAGAVHRDVKPENVLISTTGTDDVAKIADFGLARLPGATTVSQDGAFRGTPDYASPEALALGGRRSVTAAADVYGLGCVLYEMLAGAPPFKCEANDVLGTALRHAMEPPRRPAGLSDRLWDLLDRMLAKSPKQRPTAVEVAEALRGFDESAVDEELIARVPCSTGDAGTVTIEGETHRIRHRPPDAGGVDETGPNEDRVRPEDVVPLAMAVASLSTRDAALPPTDERPRPRPPSTRTLSAAALLGAVAVLAVGLAGGSIEEPRPARPISLVVAPARVAPGIEVERERWTLDPRSGQLEASFDVRNATDAQVSVTDGVVDVVPALLKASPTTLRSVHPFRATAARDGTVFVVLPLHIAPRASQTATYRIDVSLSPPVDSREVQAARTRAVAAARAAFDQANAVTGATTATSAAPLDATATEYAAALAGQPASPTAPVVTAAAASRGSRSPEAGPRTDPSSPPPTSPSAGRDDQPSPTTAPPGTTAPPPTTSPPTTAAPTTTTSRPPVKVTSYHEPFERYGAGGAVVQQFNGRRSTVTKVQVYLRSMDDLNRRVTVLVREGTGTCWRNVDALPAGGLITLTIDCAINTAANYLEINLRGQPIEVGYSGGYLAAHVEGYV